MLVLSSSLLRESLENAVALQNSGNGIMCVLEPCVLQDEAERPGLESRFVPPLTVGCSVTTVVSIAVCAIFVSVSCLTYDLVGPRGHSTFGLIEAEDWPDHLPT